MLPAPSCPDGQFTPEGTSCRKMRLSFSAANIPRGSGGVKPRPCFSGRRARRQRLHGSFDLVHRRDHHRTEDMDGDCPAAERWKSPIMWPRPARAVAPTGKVQATGQAGTRRASAACANGPASVMPTQPSLMSTSAALASSPTGAAPRRNACARPLQMIAARPW